jgi:hypothetical protein
LKYQIGWFESVIIPGLIKMSAFDWSMVTEAGRTCGDNKYIALRDHSTRNHRGDIKDDNESQGGLPFPFKLH